MNMDWQEFQKWCAALTMWREARGEGQDGMRAVGHVIDNRAKLHGLSWAQVVYQRLQFSSMTAPGDPQLTTVPIVPDPQFNDAYAIADAIMAGNDEDNTDGAISYYATSIPAPYWAASMVQTVQIGKQIFFKERTV